MKIRGRLRHIPWTVLACGLVLGGLIGSALYYGTSAYFMADAEARTLDLLLQNRALHEYIQTHTHPALYAMKAEGVVDSDFYSAELLSSSYMARHVTKLLNEERARHGLPKIAYRIGALNPRNPVNTADRVDSQLIEMFNRDRSLASIRQVVATDSGKYLHVSLPFLETGEACLKCHGDPADAPRQLVAAYDTIAGFNSERGRIRAIETIEAPLETDLVEARILFAALLIAFLSMAALVLVVTGLRRKVRLSTAELAASEQKYRTLVEDLPCFVCSFLPDGTLTYVNKLMAGYFRNRPEELVGRKLPDLVRPDVWQEASKCLDRLTCESPIVVHEISLRVRDGSVHWQHWIFRAIYDRDGTTLLYQAYAEDVTERRQAEEVLKESEARFSTVFDSSPIGLSISRIEDGHFIDVNLAMCGLLGFSRDEMVGRSSLDLNIYVGVQERERLISILKDQGRVRNFLGQLRTKSGGIREVLISAEIIRLKGREYMLASLIDVSDWKKAERAHREAEQRNRALLDAIPDAMSLLDAHGRVLDFRGAADGLEMPGGDMIGRQLDEAPMPEPLLARIKQSVATALATGAIQQIEHDIVSPHGLKSVEARFVRCSESTVLCLVRNVTDRKSAEDALRKSMQSYRALAENIPCVVYRVHLRDNNRIEFFNDYVTHITGYSVEELAQGDQRFLEELTYPDDRPAMVEAIAKAARELSAFAVSYRLVHRDGSLRYLLTRGAAVPANDGRPLYVDAVTIDLTERIQADEALRRSERKYRSYVDNAPDAVVVIDRNGRFTEVNPAAERQTGYTRAELLRMSMTELLTTEVNAAILAILPQLERGLPERGELAIRRKDGREVWWSVDGVRLSEDRYLAFCVDITETRRLRELESRAQRLETAGRIAGQVAHDFNNLLAPLTAYPDMMREDLPRDHPALAFLSSIEESAQQIAEINQQLLTLGRRGHYNQEPMNLNEIVRQVLRQMEPPPESLVVTTDLADDLMSMLGGRSQVHRALLNLVQNAREAVQDVGQVSIRTENLYVDETTTGFTRIPRGEYVRLTVTDNGCGIPTEIVEKVFDPFFTTKTADRKRGSGLGLSVVDAVVNDHHGHIDLSSRIGQGTSIYLYFPVTRETGPDQTVTEVSGGQELILVVDDDRTQREVCRQILTRLGYRVDEACGGEEALEAMRTRNYDLLVLDMIMPPGIDGAETFSRARQINPTQRAVMLSGFAESERVIVAQQMGAGVFLRKPVHRNVLAQAIRKELDRRIPTVVGATS